MKRVEKWSEQRWRREEGVKVREGVESLVFLMTTTW
jgi:hypothetical protein